MLTCWFTAMTSYIKIHDFTGSIELRASGTTTLSPFRVAQIERFLQEDGMEQQVELTLWRQEQAVLSGNGGEADAAVLCVFGDAGLVLPGELVSGYYPARGDSSGILLDQLLAHQIFGSHQVVGMPITLNEREYTVRGVLASQLGLALVQSNAFDSSGFSGILLTGQPSNAEHIRGFCEQFQLYGAQIDLPAIGWLVEWICWLPLRILLFVGIWLIIKGRAEWKGKLLVTYCAIGLPLIALLAFLLLQGSDVPASLIPPRWSDFSFYAETAAKLLSSVKQALLAPTVRDFSLLLQVLNALGWASLSFLCSLPLLQEATK